MYSEMQYTVRVHVHVHLRETKKITVKPGQTYPQVLLMNLLSITQHCN